MKKRIVGFVVLAYRYGRAPLAFVGQQAMLSGYLALSNPMTGPATLFRTRREANKAISAAIAQNMHPDYACDYVAVPLIEADAKGRRLRR